MATMPARWVFREAGSFAAMSLDTARAAFKRPVQWREFVDQLWFVASVSILPTCLVAIPFGAIIALQTGALIRQLGAVSLNGGAGGGALVREASPLGTAPTIARAAAAAICAEPRAPKIREENAATEARRPPPPHPPPL